MLLECSNVHAQAAGACLVLLCERGLLRAALAARGRHVMYEHPHCIAFRTVYTL